MDKQKLFNYEFNYFNFVKKKIKGAIYRPYDLLQESSFTLENNAKKETYNVQLTEKLDFMDQTYSSEALKYDFKTIYIDMNTMFVWKDKKFYGGNVDGLAEMCGDKLKGKKFSLSNKQHMEILYFCKRYQQKGDLFPRSIQQNE